MSAKREGMARSWEVATRELPNFWERTQGKSWAEKVGQNKKLGSTGRGERKQKENRAEKRKH